MQNNQWLIDYQIPLIVIAQQPKFQRLWALVYTDMIHAQEERDTADLAEIEQRLDLNMEKSKKYCSESDADQVFIRCDQN